jgi:acetyltransferase-like isoleucine patch superfamily enzyme
MRIIPWAKRPQATSSWEQMSPAVERTGFVGKSPIRIGRFTYGAEGISIRQWGEGASLTIGSFCSIASSVTIFLGGNHRVDWVTTFPFGHIFREELGGADIEGHPTTNGDVVVGNDVWIGHGASIMSGVSIGSGAVIAANSHVAKDVMPYEIVGGNPAKVIKNRFCKEITDLLLKLEWWQLPIEVIKEINRDLSAKPTVDALTILIKRYKTQAACPRDRAHGQRAMSSVQSDDCIRRGSSSHLQSEPSIAHSD